MSDSASVSAPANGTTVGGYGATAVNGTSGMTYCPSTALNSAAAFAWWITGLTVGHTYWFDMGIQSNASGVTANIQAPLRILLQETQ